MTILPYDTGKSCTAGHQEEEGWIGDQGEAWADLCAHSTGHTGGYLAGSIGTG